MIPAVAFFGPSGVGKTTLIERLIPELASHSLRVATIKHAGHGVALDTVGKDSWRFSQCGSDPVIVASGEVALLAQHGRPIEVEPLLRLVENEADVALVEGFKRSALPRIEVHRKSVSDASPSRCETLLAVVTDEPLDVDVPQFGFDDISGIVQFLVRHIARVSDDDVHVVVNGKQLFLKPFMKLLVARTTLGMMSAMKGSKDVQTLELSISNRRDKWGFKSESRDTDS